MNDHTPPPQPAAAGQTTETSTGRLGTRTRRTAPAHRAGQGTRRQGARGAPAQGRPADGARTHRPHAGPGQLPRDRRHRRQGELRRRQPRHPVLHPGQLRVRPRHGGWPPGGGRRRRLHPARRIGGCLDQGQAEDVGGDGHHLPHADHPADRRLRRRRLGEDDRDDRPRQPAGRADARPPRSTWSPTRWASCRWWRWAWARSPGWARRGWRPATTR